MEPTQLHFYDFDGTLFRSPWQPPWWKTLGKGWWWQHEYSLDEPCVPSDPGSDWWIGPTVQDAKKSTGNPAVYAVVATARNARPPHNKRIPELLRAQGLRFDEVHLNPGSEGENFKKDLIKSLLREHPSIKRVEVWDDKAEHVAAFTALAVSLGYAAEGHVVKSTPHEVQCDSESVIRVALAWVRRAGIVGARATDQGPPCPPRPSTSTSSPARSS